MEESGAKASGKIALIAGGIGHIRHSRSQLHFLNSREMGNLSNLGRRLSEGVAAWLQYEFHCNRGDLFTERYMAHPIGCLLAAQTGYRVQAEFNHPVLALAENSGRKPQLDFGLFKDEPGSPEERRKRTLVAAVETKWVSRGALDAAEIVWDLIRLELLAAYLKIDVYFLLAGLRKKQCALFASSDFHTVGQSQLLMPINSKIHHQVLRVPKLSEGVKKFVAERTARYSRVLFPETITIHSPSFYPPMNSGMNLTFAVYVWQIGARRRGEREFLDSRLRAAIKPAVRAGSPAND